MAKTHIIQNNFVQGEVSPLMGGRYDLDMFNAGVKSLLNMVTDSRGPVKNREGMKFLGTLNGQKARVETIVRDEGGFSVLIFTDLLMTVVNDVSLPIFESQPAPWTEDQLEALYLTPYLSDDVVYVFHPNVQTQKITILSTSLNTQEILADGNFIVPVGITEIVVCICGGGGGGGSGPGGGGGLPPVSGAAGGGGAGVIKNTLSVTPLENIPITIGAGGVGGNGGGGGTGGASTLIYLLGSILANGATGGAASGGPGGIGSNGGGNGGGTSTNGQDSTAVCGTTGTTGGVNGGGSGTGGGGGGAGGFGDGGSGGPNFSHAPAVPVNTGAGGGGGGSTKGTTFGATGGSGKCLISWGPLVSTFTIDPVTFLNIPPNWAALNWPSCGVKFQNRLWVGGAPDKPEEFWGSKTNFPEDFDLGNSAADEAIQLSIDKTGVIQWMQSTKNLVIGTINYEFIVTAEGTVLIPGDINVENQSSYTSAHIRPEVVGDQLVYVNANGRKIRTINYEWQRNNWESVDMTLPSEHITRGVVKQFAWSQENDNLLWTVLKDGNMACLTYERSSRVFGWHRHTTQGLILSADVGFDGTRSVVVLAILRQGTIYIETMSPDYPIDSYKQVTNVVPYGLIFYVEGYEHLEGQQVQILIDKAVHDDRTVGDESALDKADGVPGRIYLDSTTENVVSVVAGLGYRKEVVTLDIDGGAPTGTAATHMKRRNKIFVKLLNSGAPVINGTQYKDVNYEDNMDTAPALLSEQIQVQNLGWDREANVTVTQDGPLPLTVLAILGEVAKNAF